MLGPGTRNLAHVMVTRVWSWLSTRREGPSPLTLCCRLGRGSGSQPTGRAGASVPCPSGPVRAAGPWAMLPAAFAPGSTRCPDGRLVLGTGSCCPRDTPAHSPGGVRACVCACVCSHTSARVHTAHTQAPGVGTGQRCRESVRGDDWGSPSQPRDGSQGPAHVSGRHLRPKPCPPQRWNATVRRQVAKVSLSRAWRQSP